MRKNGIASLRTTVDGQPIELTLSPEPPPDSAYKRRKAERIQPEPALEEVDPEVERLNRKRDEYFNLFNTDLSDEELSKLPDIRL